LLGLGWCNCCFAGGAAIRAVVAPLRVLGLGPEPACTQPWRFRTIVRMSRATEREDLKTYILLLLMDMANLKPDVLFVEWPRRVCHDVLETLEGC
jgi:hypothetical protein